MPTFIIAAGLKALKVEPPDKVTFISDARLANSYSSRYAAKRHLRELDLKGVEITEIKNRYYNGEY